MTPTRTNATELLPCNSLNDDGFEQKIFQFCPHISTSPRPPTPCRIQIQIKMVTKCHKCAVRNGCTNFRHPFDQFFFFLVATFFSHERSSHGESEILHTFIRVHGRFIHINGRMVIQNKRADSTISLSLAYVFLLVC